MATTKSVIALLDSKGQDASGALSAAKAAEVAQVAQQEADAKARGKEGEAAWKKHVEGGGSHGMTRPQVANIAKRFVSPAAWELFGDDLVSEIWDAI